MTGTGVTAQKKLKIYQDHLERDHENFGTLISCEGAWTFTKFGATITMNGTWNCHGSVNHERDGSGTGNSADVSAAIKGGTTDVYNAPLTEEKWTNFAGKLKRGDVVAFYAAGDVIQHSHTCLSGTTMYGANNTAASGAEQWKWDTCKSRDYWEKQAINNPPYPDCVKILIYHKTVPAVPTNLAATATAPTQINLTWVDAANNETGFRLERKTGAAGTYAQIATPGANAVSYSDTSCAPNTQYFYRICATNAAGDSAFSNEANATTQSLP